MAENAALQGDVQALQAVYNQFLPPVVVPAEFLSHVMHGNVAMYAAGHGHLDCLKYAVAHGTPLTEHASDAAAQGHLPCLEFCHENGAPWSQWATNFAARGHIECLTYAHEHGAPWHSVVTETAAKGHLACLKYAHEHGAPWDARTLSSAISAGAVACLDYAIRNGAPPSRTMVSDCLAQLEHRRFQPESVEYQRSMDTFLYVVNSGHMYLPRKSAGVRLYGMTPKQQGSMLGSIRRKYRGDRDMKAIAIAQEVDELHKRHVARFAAARDKLHKIKVVQRAWRAYVIARRRKAVDVIQLAYLAHLCRPGDGQAFKRARTSFLSTSLV